MELELVRSQYSPASSLTWSNRFKRLLPLLMDVPN
jgi:hypothetical protein